MCWDFEELLQSSEAQEALQELNTLGQAQLVNRPQQGYAQGKVSAPKSEQQCLQQNPHAASARLLADFQMYMYAS